MIELPENDGPNAVTAMVEYFYTADYTEPKIGDWNATVGLYDEVKGAARPDLMLFNIMAYALADRIQQDDFKTLVEHKFQRAVAHGWVYNEFAVAVKEVYHVAPPGDRGDELRNTVIKHAAENAKALFQNDIFKTMVGDVPDFGRDLSAALCGHLCLRYELSLEATQGIRHLSCRCGSQFWVQKSERNVCPVYCPECRQKVYFSDE